MENSWKIYLLAVVSFLVGTSENIIAGILDRVAEDVGVSIAAAGQLITVFSLAFAFGTPVVMAATAKVGRKKLMLGALGLFIVGNAIAVLSPNYTVLMVSRMILALGTGVFVVASLTVASKLAPAGKQGSAIATLVMGFSTSLIVGVPLGRIIAASYDWKLIFAGIGLLSLLGVVAIAKAIRETEGEAPVPFRSQLALLRSPRIALALSVTFFWIFGYSIMYTYISPFLLSITGMSERAVSVGLFAFGIASLIGSKLGGFSSDKWGIRRTLLGGMLLHAAVLLLLSVFSHSAAMMFPLLMLWAFAAWSSGPTQQYYLLTLAPGASGIMLSLNSSMLQLAMAGGAGIGGAIVSGVSLWSISWLGALAVAAAAVLAAASFRIGREAQWKAGETRAAALAAPQSDAASR